MKKMFKYITVVAISVLTFLGCNQEDHYVLYGNGGETYVVFSKQATTAEYLTVNTAGTQIGEKRVASVTYDMYTNAEKWEIVPDYSECFDPSKKWVHSWPSEGNGDGRFTLTFDENVYQGDTRFSNVNIVSNGKIIKTIRVAQDPMATDTPIYIFRSVLNFGADETSMKAVPVSASVSWSLTDPVDSEGDPADWVIIKNVTKGKFDIQCAPNHTGFERQATLLVYQNSDGNTNITITVTQSAESFEEPTPEPEPEPTPEPEPEPTPTPGEGGENTNPDGGETTTPGGGDNA